ncbi:MAG: LysM peptidoglycan-binding domain-containing protein [Cytophagaceae bacterium]|nr:LysM peptidoglycan-binding domain-containing protein [Cytophagaceae bacterium]MDW8455718.1 LysM peptidoglycan-binding domain-containing protein [Cytophagaceae bacterium]
MRKYVCLILLLSAICVRSLSQNLPTVEVPDKLDFAGMELNFTDKAKKILKTEIINLTKGERYFNQKVERANLYLPIIEKTFEEENFPKDFKYLAIQESNLVSDAVSVSNAVGYWQFKKESAIEVGLRVDDEVDERKNIISATRGAARYLTRNNQTLKNWVYALLSYNLGLTGCKKYVQEKYIGQNTMIIDDDMHWYVMRFFAHKILFQHVTGHSSSMDSVLIAYLDGAGKTLEDISIQTGTSYSTIKLYNKWLSTERIPEDKIYPVILAIPVHRVEEVTARINKQPAVSLQDRPKKIKVTNTEEALTVAHFASIVYINGIKAVLARDGDNVARLAYKCGISKEDFLEYNEMKSFEEIQAGNFYYLDKKKNKALVLFHTVKKGETLWSIAQRYGVKTKAIIEKNRMEEDEALTPGRILWLKTKRPKNKPVEYEIIQDVIPQKNTSKEPKNETSFTEQRDISMGDAQHTIIHTVSEGETIFSISKKYNVAPDSIKSWNYMPDFSVAKGQKLIIVKSSAKTPETPLKYTVKEGDTLYKISRLYQVTEKQIMEWNSKTTTNIKPGEELIIKK